MYCGDLGNGLKNLGVDPVIAWESARKSILFGELTADAQS